jgi:predicted RecA/RadA family phage recombinase
MSINLKTERFKSDQRAAFTAAADIVAGTPILMSNGMVGIPANDIANGASDELDVSGRFRAWGVASDAWAVGDPIGWDANGDPLNGTAGSGAYTSVVSDWDFFVGYADEAKGATTEMGVIRLPDSAGADHIPAGAQQAISGAGAINVTSYFTAWTTTGAQAGTLANGTRPGQLKEIQLVVDGGDGTLTPASFADGTTITFSNAGDNVLLRWTASGWKVVRRVNYATGAASTPVVA